MRAGAGVGTIAGAVADGSGTLDFACGDGAAAARTGGFRRATGPCRFRSGAGLGEESTTAAPDLTGFAAPTPGADGFPAPTWDARGEAGVGAAAGLGLDAAGREAPSGPGRGAIFTIVSVPPPVSARR